MDQDWIVPTAGFHIAGTVQVVDDDKFGKVVEYSRPEGGGSFQKAFDLPKEELSNTDLVYYVIAKEITPATQPDWAGGWSFGGFLYMVKIISSKCE